MDYRASGSQHWKPLVLFSPVFLDWFHRANRKFLICLKSNQVPTFPCSVQAVRTSGSDSPQGNSFGKLEVPGETRPGAPKAFAPTALLTSSRPKRCLVSFFFRISFIFEKKSLSSPSSLEDRGRAFLSKSLNLSHKPQIWGLSQQVPAISL